MENYITPIPMYINITHNCPHCKNNIYYFASETKNAFKIGKKYEKFDLDGFNYYRNFYYVCPICKNELYVPRQWHYYDEI